MSIEYENGLEVYATRENVFSYYRVDHIIISCNYKCRTKKGAVMGKSTEEDIIALYGVPERVHEKLGEYYSSKIIGKYIDYDKRGLRFELDSTLKFGEITLFSSRSVKNAMK